jgi:hypothetical protein
VRKQYPLSSMPRSGVTSHQVGPQPLKLGMRSRQLGK